MWWMLLFRGSITLLIGGKTCLVGKLLADCLIGKNTIRSTLIKGWRPVGNTSFTNLGDNLFLIEFEHFWEKYQVLEDRP